MKFFFKKKIRKMYAYFFFSHAEKLIGLMNRNHPMRCVKNVYEINNIFVETFLHFATYQIKGSWFQRSIELLDMDPLVIRATFSFIYYFLFLLFRFFFLILFWISDIFLPYFIFRKTLYHRWSEKASVTPPLSPQAAEEVPNLLSLSFQC